MDHTESFARGYIVGRMDGLARDDEMMPHYRKWQTSTTYRESMSGLKALESFAADRGMGQLGSAFRTIRRSKETYRQLNPACPVCDVTLVFGDPQGEIGYCFHCKREWSRTAASAVPA